MLNSPGRQRLRQPSGNTTLSRRPSKRFWAKHGGGVAGVMIGSLLRGLVAKLLLALILALAAYVGIAKAASLSPFGGSNTTILQSHTTISAKAVLTKLTGLDQLHVATGTYEVNVQITQSVGVIPCFLVCNHMTLAGTGTDDEILDLGSLSSSNIEVSQASAVTVFLPPPSTGPAILDPANCDITSGHGVMNSLTQGLHNNPNGYRPLYARAETQIHNQALQDPRLLAAGENNARTDLIRLLGSIGAKQVTVNFV